MLSFPAPGKMICSIVLPSAVDQGHECGRNAERLILIVATATAAAASSLMACDNQPPKVPHN